MRFAALVWSLFVTLAFATEPRELKVLAGSAVQPAMQQIVPGFERQSGHRVIFEYGTVGGMAERAMKGEKADLVVVSSPQMAELAKANRIIPDTRRAIGRTGVGVFVRKGGPYPDIGTVESFKQVMLGARSIGYNDPAAGAPVGIYLVELFRKMGIAEEMQAKTVVFKKREDRFDAVARGDVEIGFNQVSEILGQPQVDLVGPLPSAIQHDTVLVIAALRSTEHEDAARAFTAYFSLPEAISTLRRMGLASP
jgi:molybdate transport system substrate-binding protein